jgi:alpha-glucosidase
VLSNDDGGVPLDVDVTGVRRLRLVADEGTDGKNFDHADWADANVTCEEG